MPDRPKLHPDAPPVPAGMQPKRGVEYGCGKADCSMCYEPVSMVDLARQKAGAA